MTPALPLRHASARRPPDPPGRSGRVLGRSVTAGAPRAYFCKERTMRVRTPFEKLLLGLLLLALLPPGPLGVS